MSLKYGKQKYCRVLNYNERYNSSKITTRIDIKYSMELKQKMLERLFLERYYFNDSYVIIKTNKEIQDENDRQKY